MTTETTNRTLLGRLRLAFPSLFRQRHVAVTKANRTPAPKLEPIAKILSDTGRDRGAPVD